MSEPYKPIEFGPVQGHCCICNKFLGAYWNKWLNLKTGVMACAYPNDHNSIETNLHKLGFVDYSDG